MMNSTDKIMFACRATNAIDNKFFKKIFLIKKSMIDYPSLSMEKQYNVSSKKAFDS